MCVIYIELASPYSYLCVERAEEVLGRPPRLAPIVLGAVFAHRGRGSWGHTDARAENIAIVEARARERGLPPVAWPDGWPPNTLAATRAALWAERFGLGEAFVRAAYRAAFVRGRDLADHAVLTDVARVVGLPPGLEEAGADPAVKALARERTDAAIARGVAGTPTIAVGDRLFYGDDRLEEAAAAAEAK